MSPKTWRSIAPAILLLTWPGAAAVRAGTPVSVWLTTGNLSKKLDQQVPLSFSATTGGANPVHVDETRTYQEIEGFGAAFTDSAAYLLNRVAAPAARDAAMDRLFTRAGAGIGIGFVRIPMGASDLSRSIYSYDDLPAGQTDPSLAKFSIAHDQEDIIPLVREALGLNPQLKVMANPWSPPGWMKDSGSMVGGSLLPGLYAPFAGYFVKFIQGYAAAGIPIDYISLQNEPLYVPPDYPGMSMDAATQTAVLRDHVLPALSAAGAATRVLVWDHNWDRPDFPDAVLSDPTLRASSRVAGIAWHGYGGTPGVMASLHDKYPDKGNYETELSGGTWESDQVRADFETIVQSMRSWCKTFVKWSLALDQNRGPHTGGCGSCAPLTTVNTASGAVSYTADYYTLGHFSKFVLPGALRIHSTNGAGIVTAAFLNPDGSKALVAYNVTSSPRTFQVEWGSQSFGYTLAGLSGATFTWSGAQAGSPAMNARLQVQASSFDSASGLQTEVTGDVLGGYDVGYADGGDHAVYRRLDFGSGVKGVEVRVASAGSGGVLEFHLDRAGGPLIGSVGIPITGGWQEWQTVTGPISGATGVRDLYAVFKGTTGIGNVNWFRFGAGFIRGDANLDGSVDISDPIRALVVLFKGEATPCPDAMDADDDGAPGVPDAVYLLQHLFQQGPAPRPPSACGRDTTPDALGCVSGSCP